MVSIEVLRTLPYFAGVSSDGLKTVAEIAEQHEFAAGETLFSEGEPASGIYIIRDGEIDINYGLAGEQVRTVDTVVGGDLIGWSAMVGPYLRTATAVARRPGHYVFIAADRIRDLCEQDQSLGYHILKHLTEVLSRRLQGALVQLAAGAS
jgi:CRP-like cAMP-binding protein